MADRAAEEGSVPGAVGPRGSPSRSSPSHLGLFLDPRPDAPLGPRAGADRRGDTRLINCLPNVTLLLVPGRRGPPRSFWDAPFFHPAPNTFSSRIDEGSGRLCAAFRFAGVGPDTSYQLWDADDVGTELLYGDVAPATGAGSVPAAARRPGHCCSPSAGPGSTRSGTLRTCPAGFSWAVAIDALMGISPGGAPRPRRAGLWAVATAGVLAQLTCGFYLGWFLVLAVSGSRRWRRWVPRRPASLSSRPWSATHLAAPLRDRRVAVPAALGRNHRAADMDRGSRNGSGTSCRVRRPGSIRARKTGAWPGPRV